jgi:hypothetical protein
MENVIDKARGIVMEAYLNTLMMLSRKESGIISKLMRKDAKAPQIQDCPDNPEERILRLEDM